MKLSDEIKNLLAEMAPAIPKETGMIIGAAIKKMKDFGLTDKSLRKGGRVPLFTLPDLQGTTVASIDLLEQGPLVISFYRGSW